MTEKSPQSFLPVCPSHEVDAHGHRKFYDFEFVDETLHTLLCTNKDFKEQEDQSKLINYLRENIIGSDYVFKGPFGLRKGKLNNIKLSIQFLQEFLDTALSKD